MSRRKAILIHLVVRLDVPEAAAIGRDLICHDDAHHVTFVEPAAFHLEIDKADADTEEQSGEEIIDAEGSAMMSSISCGVAQPKAVMCSSETIGS